MTPTARCWSWIIAAAMAVSGPALACSCGGDGLGTTLEQRLDRADRVQLLRVEAAILRPIPEGAWGGEHDQGSLFEAPFSRGATQYGYRVLDALKGGSKALPRVWTENISNCGRLLAVGEFVIVMYGRRDKDIWVSMCNLTEVQSIGNYLSGRRYLLDSMRAYLANRKPIHACDNFISPPDAIEPVCRQRRQQYWANDAYELRPLRAPLRSRPYR